MSFEELFPETLYQTYCFEGKRICLVCGNDKAESILRSVDREVVPLCKKCSVEWNWYGYEILKKIKPKELIKALVWYKLRHLWTSQSISSIHKALKVFNDWSYKMKKYIKRSNNDN